MGRFAKLVTQDLLRRNLTARRRPAVVDADVHGGWRGDRHHPDAAGTAEILAPFVPSPAGVGIAMLIPVNAVTVIFLGAVLDQVWSACRPDSQKRYSIATASGLIAGEALVAVLIPLLVTIGLMKLPLQRMSLRTTQALTVGCWLLPQSNDFSASRCRSHRCPGGVESFQNPALVA
jgi:hypothetical protein